MKYINLMILLPVSLFIVNGCEKNSSPLEQKTISETVTYKNPEGMTLILDSLKAAYTLDEAVKGVFTIINSSDSLRIHINTNHGPLAGFNIYDENNVDISNPAKSVNNVYYDFYFEPGQEFVSHIYWNHCAYFQGQFGGLKAYSGWYFIKPTHIGITTNNFGKWVEIVEKGEPISTIFYYNYYSSADSVKIKLFIRNRISRPFNFKMKEINPVELQYINTYKDEMVKTHFPSVDFTHIYLAPKSDYMIYDYRISRDDDLLAGLRGLHYCRIKIYCISRVFSAITVGGIVL